MQAICNSYCGHCLQFTQLLHMHGQLAYAVNCTEQNSKTFYKFLF